MGRWQHTRGVDDGGVDAAVALLSGGERERFERLRRPDDRRDYALAHALLRQTLASSGSHAAADWQFTTDDRGRPGLANGQLVFSLSHTRGLVACAVSTAGQVGLDVEAVRPISAAQIADDFFSPEEQRQLELLGAPAAALRFFDCWTLKEAYLKARGLGIAVHLSDLSFTLGADAIGLERLNSLSADDDVDWAFVLDASSPTHFVAAAVTAQTGVRPTFSIASLPHDLLP